MASMLKMTFNELVVQFDLDMKVCDADVVDVTGHVPNIPLPIIREPLTGTVNLNDND